MGTRGIKVEERGSLSTLRRNECVTTVAVWKAWKGVIHQEDSIESTLPTQATAAISHGASDPAHPAQTYPGPRRRRDHAGRSDCRPLDPRFVCTDPLPYTRLFFLQSLLKGRRQCPYCSGMEMCLGLF